MHSKFVAAVCDLMIWYSRRKLLINFKVPDDPDKPERRVHSDRHSSSKMEGEKKRMWILAGKSDSSVWDLTYDRSEISVSENGYNLRMYVCWIWWLTKYIFWKFVRPWDASRYCTIYWIGTPTLHIHTALNPRIVFLNQVLQLPIVPNARMAGGMGYDVFPPYKKTRSAKNERVL